MRIRRRNTAWLTVMGTLVALAVLSGVPSAAQAAALVVLYAVALAASLLDIQPAKLAAATRRSRLTRMRVSPQAQEAVARAARRGSLGRADVSLLDIGLIVTQTTSEGMNMRRVRSFSKDDDGVRPYITLHVHPSAADLTAVIRFEMIDHNGEPQYVHEMKTYLRDGEMNILADHQLPLAKNDRIIGAGDGDLRVYIDGTLLGALTFSVTPSLRDRDRFVSRGRDARGEADSEEGEVSLEELLRGQHRDARGR